MIATAETIAVSDVDVGQIADLLAELSQVQTELLDLLREKQQRLATREPGDLQALAERETALAERETALAERLQACHDRRRLLLERAEAEGLPSDSITSLAETLPPRDRLPVTIQIQEAAARMRLLQHQSLANWVLAQRALLHVAQLLEIMATGGKFQPTYGNASRSAARGNLLNSEA